MERAGEFFAAVLRDRGTELCALLPRICTDREMPELLSLLERGKADEALLSREMARRLSPGVPADLGAGWFEGLAGKNRYALIARLSLWRQLDEYLSGLDDETFRRALVFLRRAFADFSPNEKNDIAENLGEIWGVNAQQAAELLMNDVTETEQAVLDSLDEFDFDDI